MTNRPPWMTKSGTTHTGLILRRDDTEVILQNVERQKIRIAAGDIQLLRKQEKSLMPELLLRDMTPQEAADLLEFLSTLR